MALEKYDPSKLQGGVVGLQKFDPTKVKIVEFDPALLEQAAPPPKGGKLFDAPIRGIATGVNQIGSAVRDLPGGGAVGANMEKWGDEVAARRPSAVPTLGDIHGVGDALTFGADRFGEAIPQLAGGIAAGAAATAALPEVAVAGLIAAGAANGGLTLAQQYGGSRQAQREKGVDNKLRALGAAIPAAALDTFTGIEGRIARTFTKKAATEVGEGFFKAARNTAISEGITEGAQTELQRYGGEQSLTDASARSDLLNSVVAGGLVGGALGGFARQKSKDAPAEPLPDYEPTDILKGQGALPAPDKQLALPAPQSDPRPGVEGHPSYVEPSAQQTDLMLTDRNRVLYGKDGELTNEKPPASVPQRDLLPTEQVKEVYNRDNILMEVQGEGVTEAVANRITNRVSRAIAADNDAEFKSIEKYLSGTGDPDLYERTMGVINQYIQDRTDALSQEDALTKPDAAPKIEGSVAPDVVGAVQQLNETAAANAQEIAQSREVEAQVKEKAQLEAQERQFKEVEDLRVDTERNNLMKRIIEDPETRDPAARYLAVLKRLEEKTPGHAGEVALRDYEQDMLKQAAEAKVRQNAVEEAFLETSPEYDGVAPLEARIPEKGVTKPATPKPAAPKAKTNNYAAENFALRNYSEEELARMDEATLRRVVRQDKINQEAEAAAAAQVKEPEQGKLFTDKGNPTKQALQPAAKKPTTKPVAEKVVEKAKAEPKVETKPTPREKLKLPKDQPKVEAKPEPKAEPKKDALTHEQVVEKADKALDLGQIEPKQFQLVSIAADNATMSPEELDSKLEELIDRNVSKQLGGAERRSPFAIRERLRHKSKFESTMKAELERVGLGKLNNYIDTKFGAKLTGMADAAGWYQYDNENPLHRTIVLVEGRGDNIKTLSHEIVHALRDMGVFTPAEWATLERAAEGDWFTKTWSNLLYKDLSKTKRLEEGIAEMYGIWKDNKTVPPTAVGKIMQKIEQLFAAIGKALKLSGIDKAESIFAKMDSGEIGNREELYPALTTVPPERQRSAQRTVELPKPLQQATEAIGDIVSGKPASTVAMWASTQKLTEEAVKVGVKSATLLQRLKVDQERIVNQTNQKAEELRALVDKLPKELRSLGKNTINDFLYRNTRSREWAFQPSWINSSVKINYDPTSKLAQEFRRLPVDAQEAIKATMRGQYEMHIKKVQAVMENARSEYDALIKAAKDAGETEKEANLTTEKRLSLTRFKTLLDIETTTPYSSLRGFGDYVVVGTSPEYRKAEQDARATGNWTEVNKLQSNEDHYFVHFTESESEAAKLARIVQEDYGKGFVTENFKKGEATESMYGGREMFMAYDRLRRMVEDQGYSKEDTARLRKLTTDMHLTSLAQNSSRKAEIARRNVARGDMDMVRSAIAQMRADAHLIGSISKSSEILDALSAMRAEAKGDGRGIGDRDTRSKYVDELIERHNLDMAPPARSQIADWITNITTWKMLITSPGYFMQQVLQTPVISVPVAAAEYGTKAYAKMVTSAKSAFKATEGVGITDPLDLKKLDTKYRALAFLLEDSNVLDVGLNMEAGQYRSEGTSEGARVFRAINTKMRNLTRRFEAMNRLTTGIMAYDLELESGTPTAKLYDEGAYKAYVENVAEAHPGVKPLSEKEFAAAYKAMKLVNDTHFNYDSSSKPRIMRNPVGQVVGQFKTFQLSQIQLYASTVRDAFYDKSASKEEKAVAKKTIAFLLGHAAVFAGVLGLPGAQVITAIIEGVANSDEDRDEPANVDKMVRDYLGPENTWMSDLILNGAPTLAGLNLTGSLGQGNILSLAPYAEPVTDKGSYEAMVTALAGPGIGGVGKDIATSLPLFAQGDIYKGFEKLVPKGFASAMRAYREATGGVTNTKGDVLTEPGKVGALRSTYSALGLQSVAKSREQEATSQKFAMDELYEGRAKDVKRDWVKAVESGSETDKAAARQRWMKLQADRVKHGYARQPLRNLMRAAKDKTQREENTLGGLQYTRANRGMVQDLADTYGIETDDEE